MWREKIDKKIFESSKGKASQKERRKFIVDLIGLRGVFDGRIGFVANFKNMINDKEKIKKLFGENEEKSDTLKFINRIRDLIECFEAGNEEKIKKGILDLLDGKIPYGKKPSLIATINFIDCKITGERLMDYFAGVYALDVDDNMHINRYDKISLSIFKMSLKRFSIKKIGFYGNNEIEFPDLFFDNVKSNMKKIKEISFSVNVKLSKEAFSGFVNLKRIYFHGAVSLLGEDVFKSCNNLQEIVCKQELEGLIIENIKNSVKSGKFKVSVAKKLKINGKTVNELQNI